MQYGLVFVLNALQNDRQKIQKFQNRALRICTLATRYTSNLNLHMACQVLPIEQRCKLDLLVLMFKRIFRGHEMVVPVRETRLSSAPMIAICKPNSSKFVKCISYQGPEMWNSLSAWIRQISELTRFKKAVRDEMAPIGK